MMRRTDLVAIVEAAYRLDLDESQWLHEIVKVVGPHFDRGKGVYGFCFDASSGGAFRLWGTVASEGALIIPELVEKWHAALEPAQIWQMYRGPLQFASISQRLEANESVESDEAMRRFCGKIGVFDQLTLRGVDPTYRGIAVCTPLGQLARPEPKELRVWTHIAAHLSSGYRLRRELALQVAAGGGSDAAAGADAILDAGGRFVHAAGEAKTPEARCSLRDAIKAMDRARGALRRTDPQRAVEVWRGLVSGTWSLIEHFESDGRRYLLARKNQPGASEPKALTQRERQVVHYAALGHSTKETAYALGVDEDTVATHRGSAMRKLGVGTRVEFMRLMRSAALLSRATDD